ncbi:hypothetical protein AOLI_G00036880 [Acnodon oligacanthus]
MCAEVKDSIRSHWHHPQEVPKKFETLETICPYCSGPTPPELSPPKLFTKEAVVYGLLLPKEFMSTSRTAQSAEQQLDFKSIHLDFTITATKSS